MGASASSRIKRAGWCRPRGLGMKGCCRCMRGFEHACAVRPPISGRRFHAQAAAAARSVSPLHTFKHIAALQSALVKTPESRQTNPLIACINTKAGHGAGKPTAKIIEEAADMLAFAVAATQAPLELLD